MTRSFVMLAILHAYLVSGCAGQIAAAPGLSVPVVTSPSDIGVEDDPLPGVVYAAGEDRHWMQADDYFISDQPWTEGWIYVHLAKLRQPPGPGTKDQARFFQLDNSHDVWTEHYWRTRLAAPSELALGMLVLCFNDNARGDVYRAPASKDRARTGAWFMGKITDVSDAYKHVVRIDVYSCAVNAVRLVGR